MSEQTEPIITLLREVPLFSGLNVEELERLGEEFVWWNCQKTRSVSAQNH